MKALLGLSLESQIRDLICTSRPYYALQNLQALTDTLFQCEIGVEHLDYSELSPVSPSEAGRHLAILGSCVLAYNNPLPVKHYYLACAATLERSADCDRIPEGIADYLVCRARLEHLDNKTGKVSTSIATPEGLVIYELSVSYKVMKADLFGKLFKGQYINAVSAPSYNPYARSMELSGMQYTGDRLTAEMGAVRAERCAGHFDYYPAMPVAILSGVLVQLADAHLKMRSGNGAIKYRTRSATLQASRLAFAGEEVFLESVLVHQGTDSCTFSVGATGNGGTSVGNIEITFEIIGA